MHYLDEPLDARARDARAQALAADRRVGERRSTRGGASSTSTSRARAGASRRRSTGSAMAPFQRAILRATAAIPYGETSTYTGVATAAGSPRAQRAAGNALGANPLAIIVPCHRVLRTRRRLRRLHRRPASASTSCSSSRARVEAASGRASRARLPAPRGRPRRACRAGTTRRRAPPGSRSRRP